MKILIYSRAFKPDVGGLQTIMALLAKELASRGHSVSVVTETPARGRDEPLFRILRNETSFSIVKIARSADVCLIANISLRILPFLWASGVPIVCVHHGFYNTAKTRLRFFQSLKVFCTLFLTNIAVSDAVARQFLRPGYTIYNTFDVNVFREYSDETVVDDLIYVGRLVSEKGVDDLIKATRILNDRGRRLRLTIIGEGPELSRLITLSKCYGLTAQIRFAGLLEGEPLARELCRHRCLVVPSQVREGFGIVALEGIACGCHVIGTEGGGLQEAIGPCGSIAKRGDPTDLANKIEAFWCDETAIDFFTSHRESHLARFRSDRMMNNYLDVIRSVARLKNHNDIYN